MSHTRMQPAVSEAGDGADPVAPEIVSARPPSSAQAVEEPDWRSSLDRDLQRVASKFATPADVVRSYASLEKRLGRSVTLPDRDASPDEIEAFYDRMGRPESPDAYDVLAPEGRGGILHEEPTRNFLEAMHRAGANGATVQAAMDWYFDELTALETRLAAEAQKHSAGHEAALRREWGDAFDRNAVAARRALRRFGGNDLETVLAEAGLGSHPVFLRTFAAIGAAISEDGLQAASPDGAARSAKDRIDSLMASHYGRSSYVSDAVQSELRSLYGELYGRDAIETA